MSARIANAIACIRSAAPYLAVELILPGGSLVALILWIAKNRGMLKQRLAGIRRRAQTGAQLMAALRPAAASTL